LPITYSAEDGIYKFIAIVTGVKQDPVMLDLTLARETIHVQRREFFRLSRPLVRAKYCPLTEPEDIFGDNLISAPVKDLSGNGIAFVIPKENELELGTPVRTEIELASGHYISLVGEVIRCISDEPIKDKSLLCVYFSLIEERDRDRIIGHLFREQIDRAGRRRRLNRRN
jgi:c-di-GMP-binding flagellar brake protein YcgR